MGVNCPTFQRADTVPHRDDDTGHVQDVSGHLERDTSSHTLSSSWNYNRHHHHHHHLEREGLVELGCHVTLDHVRSSCLDGRVLTHHAHLGVEVYTACKQFTVTW